MNLSAILLPLFKQISIIYCIISIITSCNPGSKKHTVSKTTEPKNQKEFSIVTPETDAVYSANDSVLFTIDALNEITPDSVKVFLEGSPVHTENGSTRRFSVSNIFSKVGRQNFRMVVYYHDSLKQTLTAEITVLSDMEPKILSYQLIRKIPHSQEDFTQGLVYYNGWLYQGTGRQEHSTLKKIDPDNGSVVLTRNMEKKFFGEGITVFNHKIYQLTYRQKVGFVYNIGTFELIREFDLQTMEGWGLTTDGKNLIVSDGSSLLYFYDPQYFNQVGQLDVCNNRGLVINLNELEYVDGAIWANIYGESFIVKIDAKTGKVIARLELESLFPPDMPRDYDHVLNGIAYNPETRTFYMTGKYWPWMYEIKIIENR